MSWQALFRPSASVDTREIASTHSKLRPSRRNRGFRVSSAVLGYFGTEQGELPAMAALAAPPRCAAARLASNTLNAATAHVSPQNPTTASRSFSQVSFLRKEGPKLLKQRRKAPVCCAGATVSKAVDSSDYYGVLGVDRAASAAELKKSYRNLALKVGVAKPSGSAAAPCSIHFPIKKKSCTEIHG